MDDNNISKLMETMLLNAYQYDRILSIYGNITNDTEYIFNRQMENIFKTDQHLNNKPDIKVNISTPGGDFYASLSIISAIEQAKDMGYQVIGKTYGLCMSGGLLIFISASQRLSQRYTRFLIHQPMTFGDGVYTTEESRRSYLNSAELWAKTIQIIKKYTNIDRSLLKDIEDNNRDYYFFPKQAMELGIVDKII